MCQNMFYGVPNASISLLIQCLSFMLYALSVCQYSVLFRVCCSEELFEFSLSPLQCYLGHILAMQCNAPKSYDKQINATIKKCCWRWKKMCTEKPFTKCKVGYFRKKKHNFTAWPWEGWLKIYNVNVENRKWIEANLNFVKIKNLFWSYQTSL